MKQTKDEFDSGGLVVNQARFDTKNINTFFTDEGFLIDTPIVTSVGVFVYKDENGKERRELRLPEEVFADESLKSYEGKPIIVTHKAGLVTKDNVSNEIIGTMLSAGFKDGDDVRVKIIVHDTDELKNISFRELSLGYNLDLEQQSGEWNGEKYDCIQRNIRVNHLAIVRSARAGSQARLNVDGDNKEGEDAMADGKDPNANPVSKLDEIKEKLQARKDARKCTATTSADSDVNNEKLLSVKERRDRRDEGEIPQDLEQALQFIGEQDEDLETLIEVILEVADNQKPQEPTAPASNSNSAVDSEGNTSPTPPVKDEPKPTEPTAATSAEQPVKPAEEPKKNMDSKDNFEKLFAEKLEVVRVADKLNIDDVDSVSIIEGKKKILATLKPTLNLDGKNDDYINVAFDMAKVDVENSYKNSQSSVVEQKNQMFNKDGQPVDNRCKSEIARENMINRKGGTN